MRCNRYLLSVFKKSLAFLLAVAMVIALPACKNNGEVTKGVSGTSVVDEKEENTVQDSTLRDEAEINDSTVVTEEIPVPETIDFDKMLSDIMSVEYVSDYELFNEYDILSRPGKEMALFKELNPEFVISEEAYDNKSYDWYQDGIVDEQKIYQKILFNNIKGIVVNDSNTMRAVKTVSEVLQFNLDLIKKRYPDYDMDLALYVIDNLTVTDYDTDDWVAFMSYGNNRIYISFDNIDSPTSLKHTVSHELFHAIFAKSYYMDDVIISGAAVDVTSSAEAPLGLSSFSEMTVESYSYEAFDVEDPCDYMSTYMLIDLHCASTGKDRQYYKDNFVYGNTAGFTECLEDDYSEMNMAYSLYNATDLTTVSTDLPKEITEHSDYDQGRFCSEACNYLRFHLYRNLLIRLTKELRSGVITKEEAVEAMESFKDFMFEVSEHFSWLTLDTPEFLSYIVCVENAFSTGLNGNT